MGQAKAKVENGTFFGGPFGPEEGLATGRYTAEVMMPVPMVQPGPVKEVIGENGENLKGVLVKKDDFGKIVERRLGFIVGDNLDSAITAENTHHEDMKKDATEILGALRELRASGRRMAPIRQKVDEGDLAASSTCGQLMRQYQGEAEELKQRADSYGSVFVFRLLSSASASVSACVSCSSSSAAGPFCTNVDGSLRDAARQLKNL